MFKGTETLKPGEFSDIIAANGGRENAFTSWDYTGYYQTVAADRIEILLKNEPDRMAHIRPTDDRARTEREGGLEACSCRVAHPQATTVGATRPPGRCRN